MGWLIGSNKSLLVRRALIVSAQYSDTAAFAWWCDYREMMARDTTTSFHRSLCALSHRRQSSHQCGLISIIICYGEREESRATGWHHPNEVDGRPPKMRKRWCAPNGCSIEKCTSLQQKQRSGRDLSHPKRSLPPSLSANINSLLNITISQIVSSIPIASYPPPFSYSHRHGHGLRLLHDSWHVNRYQVVLNWFKFWRIKEESRHSCYCCCHYIDSSSVAVPPSTACE